MLCEEVPRKRLEGSLVYLVNLFLTNLVRISGFFLSFLSDRSVFSTFWQRVLKTLPSLRKERKTQKSSLN